MALAADIGLVPNFLSRVAVECGPDGEDAVENEAHSNHNPRSPPHELVVSAVWCK